MNWLSIKKRVQIINFPVEGTDMRAISRVSVVSIKKIKELLQEPGAVRADFQDKNIR